MMKTFMSVTPDQKIRRGNAVLEFEFPREMGNLFETELKGNGFYHPNVLEHPTRTRQPLLVQPILRAASKTGMRVTP
jgi:hypothetical protein